MRFMHTKLHVIFVLFGIVLQTVVGIVKTLQFIPSDLSHAHLLIYFINSLQIVNVIYLF